jgi:hypothetical protein
MAQFSIIEKVVINHKTVISDITKHALLELIGRKLKENKDTKYNQISKNLVISELESFIVYAILNVTNDPNIINKRENILDNMYTFLDLLNDVQRPNTAPVKLVGGILRKSKNNSSYDYEEQNNNSQSSDKIKELLDLLLMDIWYIVEYVNNNKPLILFSNTILANAPT